MTCAWMGGVVDGRVCWAWVVGVGVSACGACAVRGGRLVRCGASALCLEFGDRRLRLRLLGMGGVLEGDRLHEVRRRLLALDAHRLDVLVDVPVDRDFDDKEAQAGRGVGLVLHDLLREVVQNEEGHHVLEVLLGHSAVVDSVFVPEQLVEEAVDLLRSGRKGLAVEVGWVVVMLVAGMVAVCACVGVDGWA